MSNVCICKTVGWQARKEEVRFLLPVKLFNIESEDIGFQQCHWSRFWLQNLFTIHVLCKSPRTRHSEVAGGFALRSLSPLVTKAWNKLQYTLRRVNVYNPESAVPASSPQQTSRQFILLYSNVAFSVFQLTVFYDVTPQKFIYVFLASPSELTARNCNLDNFITMTILSDLKISCISLSRGTPIDSLHLREDASWIRKKYLFFQFRVRM